MKLDEWRLAHKYSLRQLAEHLGAGGNSLNSQVRTVHRWCNGERIPNRAMLRQIKERTDGLVTSDDFPDTAVKPRRASSLPDPPVEQRAAA